jgi:hypothetical protein
MSRLPRLGMGNRYYSRGVAMIAANRGARCDVRTICQKVGEFDTGYASRFWEALITDSSIVRK